jgi:MoxR-like ATPase
MHDDVQVSDGILEYIAEIVRNTREHTKVMLGGSPRGSVALLYAAKGYAIITEGRSFVVPDDVKAVAFNVLNHRLIVRPDILIESPEVNEGWSYKILQEIIHEAIDQAVVPV